MVELRNRRNQYYANFNRFGTETWKVDLEPSIEGWKPSEIQIPCKMYEIMCSQMQVEI